jgi:hypothetical protein
MYSLTALSSGSSAIVAARRGKGRSKQDKTVGRFFNMVGGRPFPLKASPATQITVAMEKSTAVLFTSTSVNTYSGQMFRLNDFANVAAYLGCFDQYKIDLVEVWLEPNQGPSAVYSTLTSVVDLDDANAPASLEQAMSLQGALVGNGGTGRYHRWVPHVAVAVYSGAFTSFENAPPAWIDTSSPNVQHYGLKLAVGPTTAIQSYTLTARATVSFRGIGSVG